MKTTSDNMYYEKCIIADEHGKREFHGVNGMWYRELLREGEWCLYEIAEEMIHRNRGMVFGSKPGTVVVHSRVYDQYRPVYKLDMPVMWCGKDDEDKEVCAPVTHTTEKYAAYCHTELWPSDFTHCSTCHAGIPEKFITIWRLLYPDELDQTQ